MHSCFVISHTVHLLLGVQVFSCDNPPKKAMLHLPDGIALKVKLNVLLLALFCCGPVPRTTPTEVLSHSSGALLANSSLQVWFQVLSPVMLTD